ncbi:hypothetical protein PF010_g16117 [Phytophthora fragariae]|uniref:Uncharacterized protein n=1 Tax=Phytophthora fragariae TaxID=53985 RepID=A0A6G0KRY6_9STRA|nr:hypothetical protein PF003_g9572 [Phytophthora fragariae]KAE9097044.1 hypothetical protein PF010_g16117 [Phytophthora fragariae]
MFACAVVVGTGTRSSASAAVSCEGKASSPAPYSPKLGALSSATNPGSSSSLLSSTAEL